MSERTAPADGRGRGRSFPLPMSEQASGRPRRRVAVRDGGLTLIELVVVVGIIALLAAIAIQNILRARSTANEGTAVGNLHGLMQSLQMYQAQYNGFPSDWQADMFTNASPPYAAPAFNAPMSNTLVQGYLYTYVYTAGPNNCPTACSTYALTANPQTEGWLGTRAFYADQTGRIRHCTGAGPADANGALVTDHPGPC